MEHDPLNDQAIINTNKYKIEIAKNNVNIWITITLLKNTENENNENFSYKIKISDFTLIDSFFNSFKGNIALIYKYLIRTFTKNLFIIEKDKTNNDILIVKMECLKENKKEHIQINLDSLTKIKKDEENEEDIIIKQEENEINDNSFKNCLAAPLVGDNKNLENPNDKEIFFYYKNKEKNNEYNIFIYKNEIKEHNYKEIIFKIIEKQKSEVDEYYAYLNLVDFYNMSEFYFSQFNYSIDEIYNVLLIIFSNHNYKMEKTKNFLKIAITFLNTIGSQKSFIAKAYIISFKKDLVVRNINDILTNYNIQLIKYIKKFGDDINDEKFNNLIKDPDKYINERIIKNKMKKKNEIKNIINNMVKEYEKKNNIKEDSILNINSSNKIYNKDINIVNNNIIINNKEIFDLYIKESKIQTNKNKEKENIKEKMNKEKMLNKKNKKLFNIMEDNIKIIIDKIEIEQIMKRFKYNSLKNDENNLISINENENKKNLEEDKEEKKIDNYEIKKIANNKKIKFNKKNEEVKQIDKDIEKNKEIEIKEKNDEKKGKDNDKKKEIKKKEIEKQKEEEKEKEKEILNKNDQKKQIENEKEKEKERKIESIKEKEKEKQIDIKKEAGISEKSKETKKKKTEKIKYNNENISLNSIKGNSEENSTNLNPFFLNHKRKRNLSINDKKYMDIIDPIELFINAVASRRKRFYNNTTLLSDFQLLFLLRKIEKTIPQFRYINLQIHTDIIFNYNIKQNSNIIDNDLDIIKEFYQKSKNKKNVIFLIKTQNNKTFGGFSESGFNQNNLIKNNNDNSFIFSIDKMKIYDYIEKNENCVFGYENKLPEFKNQIIFEDNNLKVGYTGNKKSGFLIEEDYELNDGFKMFYINQIQAISLNGFNF